MANRNPLQCSCLENPRDRKAWWAAVYGVAQSWTRLKQFNSNNNSNGEFHAKMGTIKDRNGKDLAGRRD